MVRVLELKWKFCMGSIKFWKFITFSSLALTVLLLLIFWMNSAKTKSSALAEKPPVAAPNKSAAILAKPASKSSAALAPKLPPKLIISPGPMAHNDGFLAATVVAGDSLASLFLRMKLSYSDLMKIMKLPKMKLISNKLKAKQVLFFKIDEHKALQALKMEIDLAKDLLIEKEGHHFIEKIVSKPVTSNIVSREGNVKGSFARSAGGAGLNSELTKQFMRIFHGQINFAKDVHVRDHFNVLYKEYYVNGYKYHNGDIVAAEMMINHHPHYAFLFDAKGHHAYFDENGRTFSKSLFIMPPVHYSHISDSFTYHRMDPVLHVIRPHLGIDYAADRGTPVKSIGDGQVAFSGRERGYGNAVIIQYGKIYKALYGHLQQAARGIHRGAFVKQGQVIGYVGSTGWATGPHVHFEVYVNGTPKNPLTLHAVSSQSVPKPFLARFKHRARQLIAKMKSHERHA